jgi:Domain of unknown function (DUF4399)
MGITRRSLLSAPLLLLPGAAGAQGTAAPKDAVLYFISPSDGATVRGPFDVRFGLKNMGVTHAGDPYPNSGHHHLLIDVDQPLDVKEPIPRDKNHLHFGAGETETRIELPPGDHTLQLVLGDAKHHPFDPPVVSDKIAITVLAEQAHEKRTEREKNKHRHHRRHRSSDYQQPYQQPWQQSPEPPYRHRNHRGSSM